MFMKSKYYLPKAHGRIGWVLLWLSTPAGATLCQQGSAFLCEEFLGVASRFGGRVTGSLRAARAFPPIRLSDEQTIIRQRAQCPPEWADRESDWSAGFHGASGFDNRLRPRWEISRCGQPAVRRFLFE